MRPIYLTVTLLALAACEPVDFTPNGGDSNGDEINCPDVIEDPTEGAEDCEECPEIPAMPSAYEAGCEAGDATGRAWGTYDGERCEWITARDVGALPEEPIEWWADYADAWASCYANAYADANTIAQKYAECPGF